METDATKGVAMQRRIAEVLFPPIEPYLSDYLSVNDGHELYYEECGNPEGVPVLYLHGLGRGCDENARRFFDPGRYRIILLDQRGSKRSRPYGSIHANTTSHLVEDIAILLDARGVKKVVLFGGSWGSTLALVYAIHYPETIRGMILGGICLGEHRECADYLSGQLPWSRFPEIGERFLNNVPQEARQKPTDYYFAKMTSDDPEECRFYAYEWSWYQAARAKLIPFSEDDFKRSVAAQPFILRAMMELFYIRNFYFLEDGYIMNNIHRIPHVPISILHGRYDDLCPVDNAIRLHNALPQSALTIVTAGHARNDPEMLQAAMYEIVAMIFMLQDSRSS